MANLLCGKQMLPAKIIIFQNRFQRRIHFFFLSSHPLSQVLFPSPPPSPLSALYLTLNAGIVLIKNSPQNARRTQYKHYFVFIVQCLSLELPAYIASYATCIIIEKESTHTPNHRHSHIYYISIQKQTSNAHTRKTIKR